MNTTPTEYTFENWDPKWVKWAEEDDDDAEKTAPPFSDGKIAETDCLSGRNTEQNEEATQVPMLNTEATIKIIQEVDSCFGLFYLIQGRGVPLWRTEWTHASSLLEFDMGLGADKWIKEWEQDKLDVAVGKKVLVTYNDWYCVKREKLENDRNLMDYLFPKLALEYTEKMKRDESEQSKRDESQKRKRDESVVLPNSDHSGTGATLQELQGTNDQGVELPAGGLCYDSTSQCLNNEPRTKRAKMV